MGKQYDDGSGKLVLRGQTDKHRDYVLTEERPYRAIRTSKWKLIDTYNDVRELYDMEFDPDELHNVIDEHKDVARELSRTMVHGFMDGKWRKGQ